MVKLLKIKHFKYKISLKKRENIHFHSNNYKKVDGPNQKNNSLKWVSKIF